MSFFHSLLRRILCSSALLSLLFLSTSRAQNTVAVPLDSVSALRFPRCARLPLPTSGLPESGRLEQRVPQGVYENLPNSVSNVEMYFTNYGVYGQHPQGGQAGGVWPRGSGDSYIHGGGIWFGAMKFAYTDPDDSAVGKQLIKRSVISFNPSTGRSWMVPGRISRPFRSSTVDASPQAINNYRLYNSREYDRTTGEPVDPADRENGGANWPVWDTDPEGVLGENRYFGHSVADPLYRSPMRYWKGPAVISDEDFFSVFKDTDLSRYEMDKQAAHAAGFPLGMEIEQRVYSWREGPYRDILIIRYSIINRSTDTLFDCWAAPVLDVDIGNNSGNERTKAAILDRQRDSLNLGVAWSDPKGGEYGYFGLDILESPAVDATGFIRKDKPYYPGHEQLGMATLRNWESGADPKTPEERYDFMATKTLDDDNGPGDKHFLAATGPFMMRPDDTAHVAIALIFAPGGTTDQWGTGDHMTHLIELDRLAQQAYDSVRTTSGVEDVWEPRLRFLKGPDLR